MPNRRPFARALLCACLLPSAVLGGSVYYSVTPLPGMPGDFEYTYYLSGFNLVQYDELDFAFPAALYLGLSNPVAGPDLVVQIFQPNVPSGAAGDFTVEASTDLGNVTGPWSIDVAFLGTGQPGGQTYSLVQLDRHGTVVGDPVNAQTIPFPVQDQNNPAPEPGTFAFVSLAFVLWATHAAQRRRRLPLLQGHAWVGSQQAWVKRPHLFRKALTPPAERRFCRR